MNFRTHQRRAVHRHRHQGPRVPELRRRSRRGRRLLHGGALRRLDRPLQATVRAERGVLVRGRLRRRLRTPRAVGPSRGRREHPDGHLVPRGRHLHQRRHAAAADQRRPGRERHARQRLPRRRHAAVHAARHRLEPELPRRAARRGPHLVRRPRARVDPRRLQQPVEPDCPDLLLVDRAPAGPVDRDRHGLSRAQPLRRRPGHLLPALDRQHCTLQHGSRSRRSPRAFGGGQPSAEAIREFLRFAFHSWSRPSPRYVLLLGDSTYDPRNFTGTALASPLPALFVGTSYLVTASDPALAAVNGEDALPDLAIGRLPARTPRGGGAAGRQARSPGKTPARASPARHSLVADNPDAAGDFEADIRDVADELPRGPRGPARPRERAGRRDAAHDPRRAQLRAVARSATSATAAPRCGRRRTCSTPGTCRRSSRSPASRCS